MVQRLVFGWTNDPKSVLGGSLGGLGRLLGGLWEAFGAWVVSWRLWGGLWIDFWRLLDGFGKWSEFCSKIEEQMIDNSDLNLVSILDGFLIVF